LDEIPYAGPKTAIGPHFLRYLARRHTRFLDLEGGLQAPQETMERVRLLCLNDNVEAPIGRALVAAPGDSGG
jgi:hypothetical protein